MTAWKDVERRICRKLGGRRGGPLGAAVSDCVNIPWSAEIKRSSRPGPPILSKWILQAKQQGKLERKPWLCVVAGHNDRHPIVAMDFDYFVQVATQAGLIKPQPGIDHPDLNTGTEPIPSSETEPDPQMET